MRDDGSLGGFWVIAACPRTFGVFLTPSDPRRVFVFLCHVVTNAHEDCEMRTELESIQTAILLCGQQGSMFAHTGVVSFATNSRWRDPVRHRFGARVEIKAQHKVSALPNADSRPGDGLVASRCFQFARTRPWLRACISRY